MTLEKLKNIKTMPCEELMHRIWPECHVANKSTSFSFGVSQVQNWRPLHPTVRFEWMTTFLFDIKYKIHNTRTGLWALGIGYMYYVIVAWCFLRTKIQKFISSWNEAQNLGKMQNSICVSAENCYIFTTSLIRATQRDRWRYSFAKQSLRLLFNLC